MNIENSLQRSKPSPVTVKLPVVSSPSGKTTKIHLRWMNYYDEQNKFIQVRAKKGGGTRVVNVSIASNIDSMIKVGKDLFFLHGKSFFGDTDKFNFWLAKFKSEELVKTAGKETFTFQNYVNEIKMKESCCI